MQYSALFAHRSSEQILAHKSTAPWTKVNGRERDPQIDVSDWGGRVPLYLGRITCSQLVLRCRRNLRGTDRITPHFRRSPYVPRSLIARCEQGWGVWDGIVSGRPLLIWEWWKFEKRGNNRAGLSVRVCCENVDATRC